MSDLSKMSDSDILAALNGSGEQDRSGVQSMSDADLMAAFGSQSSVPFDRSRFDMVKGSGDMGTGRGEALMRGIVQGASVGTADEIGSVAAASPLPGAQQRSRILPSPFDVAAGAARMVAERVAPDTFGTEGTAAAEDRFVKEQLSNAMASYDRPVESIVGNIAGGAALPVGAANTLAQGAKIGAGLGAAYGFNTGSGMADRVDQAISGGVVGGALGGALGGAAQVLGRSAPKAGNVTAEETAAAANRLGVDVPRFVATDSMATQRAAQGLRNIPFAGDPIVSSAQRLSDDLGQAADNIVTGMGSGDRVLAGQTAGTGIRDWITGRSRDAVKKAYDAVDDAVDATVTGDLGSTRNVIADILAKRQNAQITGDSKAVNLVVDAVQSRGLNYQGIKDLRSSIGEMQSGGILPEGMSGSELKRIYGALTDDMRDIVKAGGSERGVQLWERANRFNAQIARRREELAKIIGKDASAAPEQVFDRIFSMASDKGGGNINRLIQARKAIGDDDWREVGSAVIARMGRDGSDNFSPNRFVTAWGKMSDGGKAALFPDKAHRRALDDLFTVSTKAGPAQSMFANPSGTAQNIGFAGLGVSAFMNLPTTLGTILGGRVLASTLSQPATATSMARMAKVYNVAVRQPSAASYNALQSAVRNFSSTATEKAGIAIPWQEVLRGLVSGPKVSPADPNQEEQRSR